MASLRKFHDSKFWYACFTMPDGKRVQRSTKELDRKKAQRLADNYEEASHARITAQAAQRIISEIYSRTSGQKLPSSTVRAYFEAWLALKEIENEYSTYIFYRGKAKAFLRFLGDQAEQEIARISTADILAFRKAESERVSSGSVNHAIKFLRSIFEQAKRDGLITDNPAYGVALLKKDTKKGEERRRPFTLPEIEILLKKADAEWRSMVIFGFYTGARLGDISQLKWSNVDLPTNELRFISGKTGRNQILPLALPLRQHLEGLSAERDPQKVLHPRAAKIMVRQKNRVASISNKFSKLMAEAGLRPAKTHDRDEDKAALDGGKGRAGRRCKSGISFHSLRHTATSLLKNAGISPAIVGEYIGHDSEPMNRHYTHIEKASLETAANTLPNIVSFFST